MSDVTDPDVPGMEPAPAADDAPAAVDPVVDLLARLRLEPTDANRQAIESWQAHYGFAPAAGAVPDA